MESTPSPSTHIASPALSSPRRRRSTVSSSHPSTISSSSSPDLFTDAVVTPDSDADPLADGVVAKVEDPEDDIALDELEDAKSSVLDEFNDIDNASSSTAIDAPRKRGRPRKHPIEEQEEKKVSRPRTKTGCGTCRRRKKKCDETKPSCLNCEKNNVVCDGYEPKQYWLSGKQKALTTMRGTSVVPPRLPLLVDGIDGAVDQMFFQHFTCQLGKVLSLTDHQNPFLDIIIPMSMSHTGLMHSVLYLSGSCLIANEPDHKNDWQERQSYHGSKAMYLLHDDIKRSAERKAETAFAPIEDPSIAQTLVLCLQTVCAGDVSGSYRFHLDAMKAMLTRETGPFPNEQLRQFILEFLLYHDYSSSITSLQNPLDDRSLKLMEDFRLPEYMIPPQAGTLLGVLDGLFGFISRIRHIRDQMRQRRLDHNGFWWEAPVMGEVFAIDTALRAWQCVHPIDTPRWAASMLYRQCTLIYLQRTIQPSQASTVFHNLVDEGLRYLRMLPLDSDDDSTQSVLLMPLFLLGCAAFDPAQRPEISAALDRLQQWSNLGNIKYARIIVKDVWEMMDHGREHESWDWETIIFKRNWNFLIT